MVAIFTGQGSGAQRGSGSVLGAGGLLGSGTAGRSGQQVLLNAATGNLMVQQSDAMLVGRGTDIPLARTYNSKVDPDDPSGTQPAWLLNRRQIDVAAATGTSGARVRLYDADGSVITYDWNGSAYVTTAGAGAYDRIVKVGNTWKRTDGDTRTVEDFGQAFGGRVLLTKVLDIAGNETLYSYTPQGRIDRITSSDGGWVQYGYGDNPTNATSITIGYRDLATNAMRTERVSYAYDTLDRLTSVTVDLSPEDGSVADGRVYVTSYTYLGSTRLVTVIEETDGSRLQIGYDAQNRVTSLQDRVSLNVVRSTTLTYAAGYTNVTDAAGQVTRLDFNADGSLKSIQAPASSPGAAAQVTRFAYTAKGDVASVTDAAGKVTRFTFDGNGNVLTLTDRLGNVVRRTYDADNRMLTETRTGSDAGSSQRQLTTRYVYQPNGQLRFTISADGRVSEQRYNSYGETVATLRYTDQRYAAGTSAPTLAQMVAWVSGLQDQTAVEQSVFAYDARGNLASQADYAASIAPGTPSEAEGYRQVSYVYDHAGRLLNRTQAGQNTEHFVYDGLGRMVSSVDLNGGVTTIAFDDPATRTVVTMANGLVTTSTYSKAGELIAYTEAGELMPAAATIYANDALGRPRVMTSPTGIRSYMLYDRVGRKVADVGQTGEMTEYRYDATDRLVATVRYATRASPNALAVAADPASSPDLATIRPPAADGDLWTWEVYDAEDRVVERIDGTGSVTSYAYDASGRMVGTRDYATRLSEAQLATFRTTPPAVPVLPDDASSGDRVTRTFYDGDGRVIGGLDGAGYLTTVTYDAAGNRITEVSYGAAVPENQRAIGSLQEILVLMGPGSLPNGPSINRVTSHVYDRQGLLRFTIDPLGHVTGYTYSAATGGTANGQVRSTTAYAGTIAPQAKYTLASVRSALSAAGLTTNGANRTSYAVYDSAGRMAYAIAADGAVQQYRYDAMGDVVATTRFATRRPTGTLPTQADVDGWVSANRSATGDRTTRNYYGDNRLLRFVVDAEGYVTRNDYDANGQIVATVRFANRVTVDDTTTAVAVASAVGGSFVSTTFAYDAMNRLTSRIDPDGVAHTFVYNANGTMRLDIVADGTADERRTLMAYDAAGRVVAVTDGQGTAEQVTRRTTYDAFGDVVSETDGKNRATTFRYDRVGQLVARIDAAGGTTSFAYSAFGEQVQVTDPRGHSSYNYFDGDGQLVATRDAESYVTEFGYNAFGEIATTTRRANRASNAADASTRPQVASSPKDAVTSFGYDRLGRVTSTTDAENGTESTSYNAFGQVTLTTNKLGGIVEYTYNRRGLLTHEYVHAEIYNGAGVRIGLGYHRHVYWYDSRGNRVRDTEANGHAEQRITTFTYDAADRLIARSGDAVAIGLPGQVQTATPTETYAYDARGNVVLVVAADGARTQRYYDRLDRMVAEVRSTGTAAAGTGTLMTQAHDANGNVVSVRRYDTVVAMPAVGGTPPAPPQGGYRETVHTYDGINRRVTTTTPNVRVGAWDGTQYVTTVTSVTTRMSYDAAGNVVRVTDADGGEVYSYYDRANRRIAQVDAERYLTTWTLDAEGNALLERRSAARLAWASVVSHPVPAADDAADRVTEFSYDRNGRRLTEGRRNVQAWSVDPVTGALASTTTTATVSYQYNALGEVTRKTEATGDYVDYTYDNAGRLTREARTPFLDQTGASVRPAVDYRYNALGDLVQTVQNGGRITSYTYGAGGRLASSTDAGGTTRSYGYDAAGRKVAELYSRYDSADTLLQEAIVYSYDLNGEVATQGQMRYTAAGGWAAAGDVTRLAYNAHGETVARSVNDVVQERFEYDNAGRVWRSNADDGVWRFYVHDGAGHQTLMIEADTADLSAASLDQVLALASDQGGMPIGFNQNRSTVSTFNVYDRRGTMTATILPARGGIESGATPTLSSSRTVNAFGEIASETDVLGNTRTYAYNAMGRRTVVTHPLVGVTGENGVTVQANPVERSFYDVSGRLVGEQNANGAITSRVLQAGTGYGQAEALVLAEWHPDGGVIRNAYDVFGDLRLVTDEVGKQTGMSYDGMSRLVAMNRADGSTDQYGYDALGRRIRHWDSAYVSTEATDYDVQGRVIATRTFGGDTTTISYQWDPTITANGLGTQGGYRETTTFSNGRTLVEVSDTFAHLVSRTDLGGHVFSYRYDMAGRLVESGTGDERRNYVYANTGLVSSVSVGRGDASTPGSEYLNTTYAYDRRGLKTGEYTVSHQIGKDAQTGNTVTVLQNATASYDAMGRMARWTDRIDRDASQQVPANSIDYLYDAAGNVRRALVVYNNIDQQGNFVPGGTQDQWFRYDAMNRVVTDKGALADGAIVRGAIGTDIAYDAAGRRALVTTNVGGGTRREAYSYNPGGQIASVALGTLAADGSYQATGSSTFAYDAAGRMIRQIDSDAAGVAYDRSVTYNEKGQSIAETLHQRQGSDTITATTTTDYGTGAAYALGAPLSVTTSGTRNGQATATSLTTYTYEYFDGPLQSTITYKPDVNGTVTNTTQVNYTGQGVLFSATIADARPRTVNYQADALGQVIRRDESDNNPATGDPHELWFRFDGRELGHVSNNGTLETDYATSVAMRTAAAPTPAGPFRNGAASGTPAANFDAGYQPINSFYQGSDGGIYTVQAGDTLRSIARQIYGDEQLWYKVAQANGLSVDSQLVEGQVLALPRGVVRTANSADTFRPYDAGAVVGDILPDETSPTQPQPRARGRRNRCGVFGAILLAVVAVAVTALTAGALGAAIGGGVAGGIATGAIAGAAGSVASQAVGLATGIQDRFSFKSVALSALAGGVSSGLGRVPSLSGSGVLAGAARSTLGNALTQGVAVVTGLQSKFDFTGVASSAVGAAAGGVVGRAIGLRAGSFGLRVASESASGVANAATRSLINGDSFGDNLVAVLPQVIGNTVGGVIEDARSAAVARGRSRRQEGATDMDVSSARSGEGAGQVGLTGSGAGARNTGAGRVGNSTAGDAQPGDLVIIANPENVFLFSAMNDYQFGRYEAEYGDVANRQGAQWALGLSNLSGFSYLSNISATFSSPLVDSLRRAELPQLISFGGRTYTSAAAAGDAGMTYLTNPPSAASVRSALRDRAFRNSIGQGALGLGPVAYAIGGSAASINYSNQFDIAIGGLALGGALRPSSGAVLAAEQRSLSASNPEMSLLLRPAAERAGVDLALTYKPGWSVAQRAEADLKVQLLTEGNTVVSQSTRSGTSAASRYRSAGNQISSGNDIDHVIDLQLGGSDTVSNMWPLNSSVNRSLGSQIQQRIKNLPPGTVINKVTIRD